MQTHNVDHHPSATFRPITVNDYAGSHAVRRVRYDDNSDDNDDDDDDDGGENTSCDCDGQ